MFIWERIKINRRYLLIICCVLILFSRQSACVNAEQSDGNIRIKEVQQEIRKDKIEYIYMKLKRVSCTKDFIIIREENGSGNGFYVSKFSERFLVIMRVNLQTHKKGG